LTIIPFAVFIAASFASIIGMNTCNYYQNAPKESPPFKRTTLLTNITLTLNKPRKRLSKV
jgi:hypothetical protein